MLLLNFAICVILKIQDLNLHQAFHSGGGGDAAGDDGNCKWQFTWCTVAIVLLFEFEIQLLNYKCDAHVYCIVSVNVYKCPHVLYS